MARSVFPSAKELRLEAEALASAQVNIHMISTSEIKISVLIDSGKAEAAMQAVHRKFFEE